MKIKVMQFAGFLGLLCVGQSGVAQSLGMPSIVGGVSSARVAPADRPNQGVTSRSHQKNIGRIVFTSEEGAIALQGENEAAFNTEFVLGAPILWRVYMGNSLINYVQRMSPSTPFSVLQTHARYRLNLYLDGQLAYTHHYSAEDFEDEQKEKMTTFKDAFFAPGQNFPSQAAFRAFLAKNESQLSDGTHRVRVDLLPYFDYPAEAIGQVVASGEFDLRVANSSIRANDADMCLPKTAMNDPALESAVLSAFKVKATQDQWREQATLARITSPVWSVVKHKRTGVTVKRSLEAVVASRIPGGKCIYQAFGFSQDATGSSFQGVVYLDGVGPQEEISCKCLK